MPRDSSVKFSLPFEFVANLNSASSRYAGVIGVRKGWQHGTELRGRQR